MTDEELQAEVRALANVHQQALKWVRNYYGSIDSTALIMAYEAGAMDSAAARLYAVIKDRDEQISKLTDEYERVDRFDAMLVEDDDG